MNRKNARHYYICDAIVKLNNAVFMTFIISLVKKVILYVIGKVLNLDTFYIEVLGNL